MTYNLYIDTRGLHPKPLPFTETVVQGIADGGGLFVPRELPHLSLEEILHLADLPYSHRAAALYQAFGVDLPEPLVIDLMEKAYGTTFDSKDICPLHSLDEKTHFLELWHGPTSAFKDMALQCLPHFFSASTQHLRTCGKLDHNFFILVATSGDTGKAALEGFKDIPGIQVGVLYPHGGVSDIQYKQMVTQSGNNVMVWGVKGNFDDCQTAAKTIFNDEAFAQKLQEEHHLALSSANSINWGRLLPQVVYYVSSYASLVRQGKISAGDPIDVCVPTGNFGNILAAWYAKSIGTPIERLLCASNENRVLTDFINTGTYDISHREFVLTPSPSMDILVSSNLERQLFELTDRNPALIREWMKDLKEKRMFRVDSSTFTRLRETFSADCIDNATCLATIKEVFEKHHYLLDPHTAVAYQASKNLRGENPVVIAATAHWAKFGRNVYRALHDSKPSAPLPPESNNLSDSALNNLIAKETACYNIPQGLLHLDDLPVRFNDVIEKDSLAVEKALVHFLDQ